ncbi:fimbria/pilus outer membrane usher protein [Salinimonas marina]|uniref:fimbria/pilus outer membrane usher protein n=1 Tax=Salinimonas marina TaxID=2785918 RepID=UPI001C555841|nr:fimbria/pilus outer membrane usher protein [Salinimonas marina]
MDAKSDSKSTSSWFGFVLLAMWVSTSFELYAAEVPARLNPTGRDIELISLLRMSDTILGEAQVTLTAEDDILLPKDSTIVLLEEVVIPEALNILRAVPGEILTPSDFRAAGLDLMFDMSSLECIVTVPGEVSLTRSISLMEQAAQVDYVSPEFFSGFVNLNLIGNENQTLLERNERQSIYGARIESAVNIGRANFEYEAIFENSSRDDARYQREGTRLNLDFPHQGTRLVVGDMYNPGASFQDGSDILGVGITRDFTLIPTRNARPTASQQFTLLRASQVDVVIDGVVVQRLSLGAGSYDLSDIPLAQGTNDVQLVITNSVGQRELIQFSVATGNELLAAGEFEYSLMYGVPRVFVQNELDYLFEEKVLHGYFEVGLTPWLTVGINGQQREQLHQLGASILFASGVGVTELAAARSTNAMNRHGEAYRLAFDALFDRNSVWQPQFSLVYEYRASDFVGINHVQREPVLDIEPLFNTTNHFISAFGSLQLSEQLRGR